MNESPRAVARACYGVTVWLHRMWCSQSVSNRLLWRLFFLCKGRCGRLLQRRSRSLPNYLAQLRSREVGRGGGGRWKRDGCVTVRVEIRVTLRVHILCVLRVTYESPRAVARACYGVTVWLHRMWCSQSVSNRLLWRLFFLCKGRCGRLLQRRSRSLPALRGSTPAVAAPYFLPTS